MTLTERKERVKEIISILENLNSEKDKAIKSQEYERAAKIRDDVRKFTDELEDLMNPREKDKN
jgi:ATP-dependent Clp protease ATP-binding subunit ClpC